MGCDIHSHVETYDPVTGKWEEDGSEVFPEWDNRKSSEPFGWRNYGVFAFIADVRNYSAVPLNFGEMPRGIPADSPYSRENSKHTEYGFGGTPYEVYDYEPWGGDNHSMSWLSLRELVDFNYDQTFEDRRTTVQTGPRSWNGGHTAEVGGGEMTTYRDYLGKAFFEHLEILKTLGEPDHVRIVFWFDN